MKVKLANVRLAFPALFEMESVKGGKPAYGARFILAPNHPGVAEIRKAIKEVAEAKWPGKGSKVVDSIRTDKQKMCWFESNYVNDEGDVYDGFDGMYHLGTKSQVQPLVIDRDRTELTARDGRPYSGCYVNATVEIWAQDNEHGKGIRAQVTGVQFLKDGDAFAGGTRASADEFEDLSDMGIEEDEFA